MSKEFLLEGFFKEIKIDKGLYIVATPIGNRYDITIRAIRVLDKSDAVICEDTRVTKKLFTLLGISIKKKWITYNDHSNKQNIDFIIKDHIKDKIVSFVSDAGTPLVSDPGYKLIREIRKNGYNIFSIPGPCAAISALALSGLKTDKFCFLGFLPKSKNDYLARIRDYSTFNGSLILYETTRRLPYFLKIMRDNFSEFKLVIVREMTKLFEEIHFITSKNINEFSKEHISLKGELTIIIEISNSINKVYTDKEIISELKKLKPSQVSAMLSKKSSESREVLYKRCMSLTNEKYLKK
ncbi:MAG: 16S rRNA (cytidine(1402)-2'-O)-methyltransferase [Rickettsiales bacterium]|nr:16S rRNA (cytidine(1402)-2'-O)-methyltransferase [Rickettsiales bacterium]OUV76177.1 MAG: 16S rRNA (cytidine(1402)-2'-O)-methyltransferase [Rickettsiales bacterium TMED131]|tara:strand:+ start:321 stop:1208 length:888 start_codon:yes stop_codon:yes gene_type:complete